MATDMMSKRDRVRRNPLLRGILVGSVLGLYFGFFFRPVRQPTIEFTLALALTVTVVLVCIQAIRKRPPVAEIVKSVVVTFAKSALFLLLLDARHIALALGGRPAVLIFSTVVGAVAGLVYTYTRGDVQSEKE